MKSNIIRIYGFIAVIILISSLALFGFSLYRSVINGEQEAQKAFNWIYRETISKSLENGFMTDSYIATISELYRSSRMLKSVVISTPSGTIFSWPNHGVTNQEYFNSNAQSNANDLFSRTFSTGIDIGSGSAGSVILTAVISILDRDAIFLASRNSFFVILGLLMITIIMLILSSSEDTLVSHDSSNKATGNTGFSDNATNKQSDRNNTKHIHDYEEKQYKNEGELSEADSFYFDSVAPIQTSENEISEVIPSSEPTLVEEFLDTSQNLELDITETDKNEVLDSEIHESKGQDFSSVVPEGLYSPFTGIGWQQYLEERLDSELIRASSSELDLSLIIIRISGLLHTDLLSRKIAEVLLESVKFRDLTFEFGQDGFAGIIQNVNLDSAMKIADTLYAHIDSLLIENNFPAQITIGLTTRTARLLPASRLIQEAVSAAKKAIEESTLPIVAFRANPEKYREYVAK